MHVCTYIIIHTTCTQRIVSAHTYTLHENYTLRTHDLMVATKLAFLYEEPNSTGLGNKRLLPSPVERRGRRGREGEGRGGKYVYLFCMCIYRTETMYVAARVVTDRQIDIHIHKASTVTLAV